MSELDISSGNEAVKTKAQSLADKMNELTSKFDLSEEMIQTGSELEEYVEEKTKDVGFSTTGDIVTGEYENMSAADFINLELMVRDFKYVRESLKETTNNGRRVLQSITLDLLDEDEENRASLITSFAELNKAIAENMKLYMQSYKDISTVLLNLDKISKSKTPQSGTVTNNTVVVAEPISTADLIKQLSSLK